MMFLRRINSQTQVCFKMLSKNKKRCALKYRLEENIVKKSDWSVQNFWKRYVFQWNMKKILRVPSLSNKSLLEWHALFLNKCKAAVSAQSYNSGVLYCRKKYSGIFSDEKGNWPSVFILQRSTLEKEKK